MSSDHDHDSNCLSNEDEDEKDEPLTTEEAADKSEEDRISN